MKSFLRTFGVAFIAVVIYFVISVKDSQGISVSDTLASPNTYWEAIKELIKFLLAIWGAKALEERSVFPVNLRHKKALKY